MRAQLLNSIGLVLNMLGVLPAILHWAATAEIWKRESLFSWMEGRQMSMTPKFASSGPATSAFWH
jgi:hypothetical protein